MDWHITHGVRLGFDGFFDGEIFGTAMAALGVPVVVLPRDIDERDMVSAPLFTPSPVKDERFPSSGWVEYVGEGMRPPDVFPENLTRAEFAQVGLSLVPAPRLRALVRKAVRETLPSNFTAVHVRVEADWAPGLPAEEKEKAFLAALLEHVVSQDARPLYLAGGELPLPLRQAVEAHGVAVYTKDHFIPIEIRDTLWPEQLAVIDFYVALQADRYIGADYSSFTEMAHFRRVALHRVCCKFTEDMPYECLDCMKQRRAPENCRPRYPSLGWVADEVLLNMTDPLSKSLCGHHSDFMQKFCPWAVI
jgi:hypothetical protein